MAVARLVFPVSRAPTSITTPGCANSRANSPNAEAMAAWYRRPTEPGYPRSVAGPISFISDFGRDDEFVGVVHAVIARLAPSVRVIDLTHGIRRGDIRSGALALTRAIQYLPEGVALAVVDPTVGTARRALAAAADWGFFV